MMQHVIQSLATIDPFNPEMPMKTRREIVGGKACFVMDLAWAGRVLKQREEEIAFSDDNAMYQEDMNRTPEETFCGCMGPRCRCR